MSKSQRSSISRLGTFLLTLVAAAIFAGQTTSAQTQEQEVFSDVAIGDNNYVAIKYLKEHGLIDGYEDGTFKPLQEINRAEALKVLLKAIIAPKTQNPETFSFADVKTSDWFYSYVTEAWHNYLVKGYPDGLFHPEKTINRAESLKILLQQEGKSIPAEVTQPPYTDVPVSVWYAPYAQISKERSLFLENRTDGGLHGEISMNRGEFADLIYRVIKSQKGSRFARATWYADFMAKQSTASGEPYEPDRFTAAHKTLPFGTKLLVTRLSSGKSVEVTVNDRGPYATGIDLDLSRSAFEALASAGTGITEVEFEEITSPTTAPSSPDLDTYGF